MGNFSPATPKKAARKQREKKARSVVDGRTLKAKGRSAQVNIKVRPEVKERLLEFAEAEGVLIADWFEQLVEALAGEGIEMRAFARFFGVLCGGGRDRHRGPIRLQDQRQ